MTDDPTAKACLTPNDWRTVSTHGQPPPNTLIDYIFGAGYEVSTFRTRNETKYGPNVRWRLSDLPPLDRVQPLPAPPRPEPKFKSGAEVLVNGTGRYTVDGPPEWDDGEWYYDLDGGEGGCPLPVGESGLLPAPETPVIPIGGWFATKDDETPRQREECDHAFPRICATKRVHWTDDRGVSRWEVTDLCTPLSEREAMERRFPAGTWLRDKTGRTGEIREWRGNETNYHSVWAYVSWDGDKPYLVAASFVRRCTVLPGPPLPKPWKSLDTLPKLGRVLVWTDTGPDVEFATYVRNNRGDYRAWADLDELAPIPGGAE